MDPTFTRRLFLAQGAAGLSSVWVFTHWPALLAAADHAHSAAQSAVPAKFEFFSLEEAKEIEAISARIIPSDDSPGAREAGVVYFIDRALVTFAKDQQQVLRDGLPSLHALTKSMLPQYSAFSQASPEQQDQILHRLGETRAGAPNVFEAGPAAQNFFEVVRWLTIAGFLIDPDTRGNPSGIGWKLIGRDREHAFQPPFGYYDKNYPGWQPAPAEQKDGAGQ